MILFPPAKINLGLYITGKRSDGYHNLETVFLPVPALKDALEAVPAVGSEATLTVTGVAVEGGERDNLVWKAYTLMKRAYPDAVLPLDWHLHKAIPTGAGLGGGSADGAYALRIMAALFSLNLSPEKLNTLALQLGSDCPFFLHDAPQFGTGRGEILTPLSIDLSDYNIRVETPGIHVSTAEAFRLITPRPAPFDLRTLPVLPLEDWRHCIGNDFEEPVFSAHHELRAVKERLYREGAVYAQMSGSGSAVLGIFPKQKR